MSKRKSSSGILHATAIRLRVTGNGNLIPILHSLDNVKNSQLANVTMAATTNIEPTKLANFKDQRVQLELRTVLIDEIFSISKIIVFVKEVAESYPV